MAAAPVVIARDRTSTQGVHIEEVLAVNHDEVDECDNLTDICHCSRNVDGAQSISNAFQLVLRGSLNLIVATLVDVHCLVDGQSMRRCWPPPCRRPHHIARRCPLDPHQSRAVDRRELSGRPRH